MKLAHILPIVFCMSVAVAPHAYAAQSEAQQAFQELFAQSAKDKRGLTFFVKGQQIPGIVTRVTGDAVEVRSQTHNRVIIRIDQIDAVAGY